jgi:uncharacterized damage-inducible protein DinB
MNGPDPIERVATSDEREALDAFLDHYRRCVVGKARGLSEEDCRRRLVPSLTTVGGIVKHLRWVEVGWFHLLLGERSGTNQRAHRREVEFTVEPDDTLGSLIEEYRLACNTSREIARHHGLDDAVPHDEMGKVSVRWIYLHLIEETARHAGQLGILREQLDGATGPG